MPQDELSGPDLAGVVADANAVGLAHVVIGGFSVIFHGYVRATQGLRPAGFRRAGLSYGELPTDPIPGLDT